MVVFLFPLAEEYFEGPSTTIAASPSPQFSISILQTAPDFAFFLLHGRKDAMPVEANPSTAPLPAEVECSPKRSSERSEEHSPKAFAFLEILCILERHRRR